jgi:hypothetical protein
MSPATTNGEGAAGASKATKNNIGVFTNPKHDLWVAEATPSSESVQQGQDLKPGEVTIAVRSTGICGYVLILPGKLAALAMPSTHSVEFRLTNMPPLR